MRVLAPASKLDAIRAQRRPYKNAGEDTRTPLHPGMSRASPTGLPDGVFGLVGATPGPADLARFSGVARAVREVAREIDAGRTWRDRVRLPAPLYRVGGRTESRRAGWVAYVLGGTAYRIGPDGASDGHAVAPPSDAALSDDGNLTLVYAHDASVNVRHLWAPHTTGRGLVAGFQTLRVAPSCVPHADGVNRTTRSSTIFPKEQLKRCKQSLKPEGERRRGEEWGPIHASERRARLRRINAHSETDAAGRKRSWEGSRTVSPTATATQTGSTSTYARMASM